MVLFDCGLPGASDGVEVPIDQHLDVRFSFVDSTKNLPATGFRFDIADTHLEIPHFYSATGGTTKSGKPYRDLTEKRRDHAPL
jgi:hypothetical protein